MFTAFAMKIDIHTYILANFPEHLIQKLRPRFRCIKFRE